MYRNKKMFSQKIRYKKALDYTYICHIFKLKSLHGMLKYKVKMFFLLLLYRSIVKNIVFKYILLKLYNLNFWFLISFFSVYNNVDSLVKLTL